MCQNFGDYALDKTRQLTFGFTSADQGHVILAYGSFPVPFSVLSSPKILVSGIPGNGLETLGA
jgi:hypothetical protein